MTIRIDWPSERAGGSDPARKQFRLSAGEVTDLGLASGEIVALTCPECGQVYVNQGHVKGCLRYHRRVRIQATKKRIARGRKE